MTKKKTSKIKKVEEKEMKKNLEIEKKNKVEKKIIVALFLLLFFAGLIQEIKVGFYNDELMEQNILRGNVLEYAEILGEWNDLALYYKEHDIVPISQSIEKDHGVAPYLPIVPFLAIGEVSKELLGFIWHSYTYLIFFLGVIMVYKIINHLFHNRKVSLVSALVYMSSPRIFAEGLYNNKDIVLMSLVLATIYLGMHFLEKKTFKSATALGIVAAFAFNVKIIGGFIFGVIGCFYLVQYLIESFKDKKFWKKELAVGFTAIIVMLITFIIITPAIWGTQFDLIGYFRWCFTQSTKFSRWKGTILFEGQKINYAAGEELPLYYLPKMIMITTPIYIQLLFLVGVMTTIYNLIKKKEIELNKYFLMILICFIVPILVALITHTRLYNGWRHFYFLHGPIVLLAIYGVYQLNKILPKKKLFYTILGCCVSFYLVACLHNGVNNTAYYNILVNHKDLREIYELDYYGTSAKQVLREAEKNRKEDFVYIYGRGYGFNLVENNYYASSRGRQSRIKITNDEKEYQKWVEEGKEVYIYYNNVYNSKELVKGHKKVYSISSWGNDMSALYR